MKVATRSTIDRLQAVMATMPQVKLETKHYFADGMYCRELSQSQGTTIIGKVHLREHFFIVLSGDLTIVSDGARDRVKGARIVVSKPGTKRAIYAHRTSTYITVHRTDSTDLEAIERELIEEDPTAMYLSDNTLKVLK